MDEGRICCDGYPCDTREGKGCAEEDGCLGSGDAKREFPRGEGCWGGCVSLGGFVSEFGVGCMPVALFDS